MALPRGALLTRDLLHGTARKRRTIVGLRCDGTCVLPGLDQQPPLLRILFGAFVPHECPLALQLLSLEFHLDLPLTIRRNWVRLLNLITSDVPDHHRATAVLTFGNHSFESR